MREVGRTAIIRLKVIYGGLALTVPIITTEGIL